MKDASLGPLTKGKGSPRATRLKGTYGLIRQLVNQVGIYSFPFVTSLVRWGILLQSALAICTRLSVLAKQGRPYDP